jgi:hypothetical protein
MEPHEEFARVKLTNTIREMPLEVLQWQFLQAIDTIERLQAIIEAFKAGAPSPEPETVIEIMDQQHGR